MTDALRGTKRKRAEEASPFTGKLHHALKEVRKAAKKARTFETQRVVKKLKGLRKKASEAQQITVLEAELEELKTTDPDTIADTALRTRLLKDHHISSNDPARAAIERELPPPTQPPPSSKVHARLFSSRALAAVVAEVVSGLRALILSPPTVDDAEEGTVEADREDEHEDPGENEEENEEEAADAAGWESGSVDDADVHADEKDDGWESGSVHSAPDSDSSSDSESDSGSAPPAKKKLKPITSAPTPTAKAKSKPPAPSKSAPTPAQATSSQFLPSLAVGYVRGGSSDFDLDDDVDAEGDVGARKNRRGQRARRAIWEKKYGGGANHKKKEREAEEARVRAGAYANARRPGANAQTKWKDGQQGVKGAKDRQHGKGGGTGRPSANTGASWKPPGRPTTSAPTQASASAGKPSAQTKEPGTGLHPSWAAKRAMKERGGGAGAIVPSQGKKIVF